MRNKHLLKEYKPNKHRAYTAIRGDLGLFTIIYCIYCIFVTIVYIAYNDERNCISNSAWQNSIDIN